MHEPRIALQIITEVHIIIDDELEVVNGSAVIAASKIQCGDFIVENKYPVMINIEGEFGELRHDIRNHRQSFFKRTGHQALVDARKMDIDIGMNSEIIVVLTFRRIIIFFKFFQDLCKFSKMTQVKKRIQHIVHAFDIVTRFHCNHQRFLFKKIDPFLSVPVVHQKILTYKCKPAIALIEVELLIKISELTGIR